ncbi:UNVERIFIED_CONTAM: hypothetical protein GTU68_012280 [Idotea baltica]|nr:hypothetical protein [Idotea baltica]
MKTDHNCGRIWEVYNSDELRNALKDSTDPIIVGGGSNILFTGDIKNDLIIIRIEGRSISQETEDYVNLSIGAGEDWHEVVLWSIENNWGGIENLSLIPGLCGAAPMQNIGAYGTELKDVLNWVEVMDRNTQEVKKMQLSDCQLGYRNSIFKNELKNKIVITAIGLRLAKSNYSVNTSYGAIEQELNSNGITNPSIREVSQAVINIRNSKLPNPKKLPNNGSFFKNPIIDMETFESLLERFPNIPHYPTSDGKIKLPAGWLIDQAGLKGKRKGSVGTYKNQALVIVNYDSATGREILEFARYIQYVVQEKYGITILPEVNIYPA